MQCLYDQKFSQDLSVALFYSKFVCLVTEKKGFIRHAMHCLMCSYHAQLYQELHLWHQQAGRTTARSGQDNGGLKLQGPVLSLSVPHILQAKRSGAQSSQEKEGSLHVKGQIRPLSDENSKRVRQRHLPSSVKRTSASNSTYLLPKRKYWSWSLGLCHLVEIHQQ